MALRWVLCISAVLLTGCGSLAGVDTVGTMEAADAAFAQEATAIIATMEAVRTSAAEVVVANETEIAERRFVNQQIRMTVVAGASPTPGLTIGAAPPPSDSMGSMDDMGMVDVMPMNDAGLATSPSGYVTTGVSTQINAADGCVINPQATFSNVQQLYATFQGSSVQAGAPLRAEWSHNGVVIQADDWTVPRDAPVMCFWGIIDRLDTDFPPGQWSVQVFANGQPIGTPMAFSITE
jgi:hypothetical protein